jgi:uncharacterized membrane protein
MVVIFVSQGLLSGVELTMTQIYALLVVLGIAVFATWLYFQLFVKGIRDSSRKNMIIVSSIALVLFFVGIIGYVLFASLGYTLGFLRGYDVYFYTILLLMSMILCIIALLMYWSEIRWQRRKKAQLKELEKETRTLRDDVRRTEVKEEETGQLFQDIKGEIEEFHDVYDEFKEK